MPEQVTFKTDDSIIIVGDWYTSASPNGKVLLLLHMMPAVRGSWHTFAEYATERGYHVLAIDLRGHGESVVIDGRATVKLDYKKFENGDHQKSKQDVTAAIHFLQERGFDTAHVIVGGASIGANLALHALITYSDIPYGFALSPGLDYHGITTKNAIASLAPTQKFFLAASDEDEYSAQTVAELQHEAPDRAIMKRYGDNAGHGTTMFLKHPELMQEILEYGES